MWRYGLWSEAWRDVGREVVETAKFGVCVINAPGTESLCFQDVKDFMEGL